MENQIPVLELGGSARKIGEAHGEMLRSEIQDFVKELKENFRVRTGIDFLDERLSNYINANYQSNVLYAQPLVAEMEAIAEASNSNFEDVLLLNSFLELVNLRNKNLLNSLLGGCTSLACMEPRTEDKKIYLAQNFDMEGFYKKYAKLLLLRDTYEGGETLVFTYAGILGCMGFNNSGVGVAINFLHSSDARSGIIYPVIVRNILRQERIGDAIGATIHGSRAGGINYLIASNEQLIINIETSATDFAYSFGDSGILTHSNHYMQPRMEKYDLLIRDPSLDSSMTRRGSSIVRQYVAREKLLKETGRVNIEYIKNILQDHTNEPFSICCHGLQSDNDMLRPETTASIIIDLEKLTMHISWGNPCNNNYVTYKIRERAQ